MQRIAAELRAPGTAFVSASTRPDAQWRLRMFTPRREVGYSGHTALGGTHALIEAGRLPGAQVVFDTSAGLLRVEVERGDERHPHVARAAAARAIGRPATTCWRCSTRSGWRGPGSGAGRGRR